MDSIDLPTKNKLKGLGYYQIVGGILGIFFGGLALLNGKEIDSIVTFIALFFFALYILSIYSGLRLILGAYKTGLRLSLINQFLQVFSVTVVGISFKYVSGISLMAGVDLTSGFKFMFDLSLSKFELLLKQDQDLLKVGFNFVPLFIIYHIDKLQKYLSREPQS